MKVTLDTNILVSGTFWTGDSFRILDKIDRGKIKSITSRGIITEYYKTINSDEIIGKIKNKELLFFRITEKVIKKSKIVEPKTKINIIKDDPGDNKVLECAKAGNVDYLISNDKHMLKLKKFENISILTPADFLKKLK